MKKTFRIKVITLTLIIIALVSGITSYFIIENSKKYEIAKVEEYNYFVVKENSLSGVIDKKANIIINLIVKL